MQQPEEQGPEAVSRKNGLRHSCHTKHVFWREVLLQLTYNSMYDTAAD